MRVWQWRPGNPLALGDDATYVAMEIKDVLQHGWYWHNHELGWPFGQVGALFPDPSLLNILGVKAIGIFSSDPFTVAAMWFWLGYPLAALTMYWLVRHLGLGRVAAVVSGTLFAVAPGHQTLAPQLWLASYWVLPLGMSLVLDTANGTPLFTKSRKRRWTTVACVVTLGLGHIYYVGFVLLLLGIVIVVRWFTSKRIATVLAPTAAGAGIAFLALAPLVIAKVATRDIEVTGTLPATRPPDQSEMYAGKLMDLILPWWGHRVTGLSALHYFYALNPHPTLERPALGLVALGGTVALAWLAARRLLVGTVPRSPELLHWSFLSTVSFGFFTVGAFGSVVAYFFTPQLRTWSRLWIVMFLLGLLAVAAGVDMVLGSRRVLGLGLAASLVLLGVWDQTNPAKAPNYRELGAQRAELAAYANALRNQVGDGCAIFQLPVTPFPEATPVGQALTYDQQLPWIMGSGLSYSGGAMRGTSAGDWQLGLDTTDIRRLVRDLRDIGYCAVEVAHHAYQPSPDPTEPQPSAADPSTALATLLGRPIASSADGGFSAYTLHHVTPSPDGRAALAPVLVSLDAYKVERSAGGTPGQWLGPRATLRVVNLGARTVPDIEIEVRLSTTTQQQRTVQVIDGSRVLATARLNGAAEVPLRLALDAPPGTHTFDVTVSGDAVVDTREAIAISARAVDLRATSTSPDARVMSLQQLSFP